MALTDAVVRQAKITGKDYTLTEADGLILFVSGKGVKKWHLFFQRTPFATPAPAADWPSATLAAHGLGG